MGLLLLMGDSGPRTPDDGIMVFAFGESNSGGEVLNTSATAWELESRPELAFLNVSSNVFQSLDVGTNNNLDHFGLDSTKHSWELGLANRVRENYVGSKIFRYVQCGQGGSRVAQWNVGGSYWAKFLLRANAAKAARPCNYVVWFTLGINDTLAAVSAASWKTSVIELLGRIKTVLPGVKIYMTELMDNSAEKIAYNTALSEIAADDADVFLVSQSGLTLKDIHHWDYASQKEWSLRFLRAMRADFGNFNTVEWTTSTCTQNAGGRLTSTAVNQHAYIDEVFNLTDTFAVYSRHTPTGNGLVVVLDSDVTPINWGTTDPYLLGWYAFNSDMYRTTQSGATGTLMSSVGRDLWRVSKSGNDLVMASSADGGNTWTTQHTRSGILTGLTTIRVKALSAVGGTTSVDLWVQR